MSYANSVQIYVPTKRFDKPPKWTLLLELAADADHGHITSLSWGTQNELLTASRCLTVWVVRAQDAAPSARALWARELATQVHTAAFSPDSSFIASIGFYDQNVKLWSRLSFDHDNVDFEFSYLPHPDLVSSLRWRQPLYASQSIPNTLYTSCSDSHLRVWQALDIYDSSGMELSCEIDLLQGAAGPAKRFAFMLDNGDLAKAIENALIRSSPASEQMKRITDLAQLSPDLCVILTEQNKMDIYTVENLGKHDCTVGVRALSTGLSLPSRFPNDAPYLTFFPFFNFSYTKDAGDDRLKDLSIIVHDYSGSLLHYTAYIDRMLDPAISKKHWSLKTILTGHNKSVQRLFRTADGRHLLSISRFNENYVWSTHKLEGSVTLKRRSLVLTDPQTSIQKATLLKNGEYLLTFLQESICLWDCTKFHAEKISEKPFRRTQEAVLLLTLPESEQHLNGYRVLAIYPDKSGRLWQVNLPSDQSEKEIIEDLGVFELPMEDEMLTAVRVDPVGWTATVDHNLESSERVVMATMSPAGMFRSWTASVANKKIGWREMTSIDTGIQRASRLEVSSINKVAIVCAAAENLSIWDMTNGVLEFEQRFDNPIADLDWTGTPDAQGILAVGLLDEVVLYSQLRFDYTNRTPAWTPVKKIGISMYTTHDIGDSIWLYGGSLAIGAGNQFFIADPEVDITDTNTRILTGSTHSGKQKVSSQGALFEVCAILNGPLPVYHPQFLIQCLFGDKLDLVKRLLVLLLRKIKFAIVLDNNVIDIQSDLGLLPEEMLAMMKEKTEKKENFSTTPREEQEDKFDAAAAEQLQEQLQKVSLPFLTQHQQMTLVSVVEGVMRVEDNVRSIDASGIKFLLGYRLYMMHRGTQDSMTMRDFNWAMHSESQDLLFDAVKKTSPAPFMWHVARDTGMPYWLRTDKLREMFEELGRNHFIKGGRDPTKCTLFYLALRKKQVLLGLWRTASWHKEQAKTLKLLGQDFGEEKHRTTALKNAYALLGKHRFEYAAAFFLLGDSLRDAVNVICKNMQDVGLAVAVARVYGGEEHEAFPALLCRHVLPRAVRDGDRWTTSWALWRVGERESAIQALVKPPREILESSDGSRVQLSPEDCRVPDNKLFLVDDPVLVMLYRALRKQNIKNLLGAVLLSPRDEFNFVLKTASIYRRMGCDILALSLVRNWTFILDKAALLGAATVPVSVAATPKVNGEYHAAPSFGALAAQSGSILDNKKLREAVAARRSSLFGGNAAALAAFTAAASAPPVDNGAENSTEEAKKDANPFKNFRPAPAVAFKEPDMSAFNFGF